MRTIEMLAPVELHNKMPLATGKICKVRSNRVLPDELKVIQSSVAQFRP